MASCSICSGYFPGSGRRQRCDDCLADQRCVTCGRSGATKTSDAKCADCRAHDRTCRRCGSTYTGRQTLCNQCRYTSSIPQRREASARWRASQDFPRRQRGYHLQRKYGISIERFDEMLAEQGGACRICGATEPGGRGSWHVDHDHECCASEFTCGSCLRSLLCHRCNVGLGWFTDSAELLIAAAEYIQSTKKARL